MRLVFTIVLALLLHGSAHAQRFGLDTLAGVKYPKVVRQIPNEIPIGVFAETFGDAFPLVKKEIYAGRSLVRVQFIWSDTHSFGDKDIPTLKRLAKRYAPLCVSGRLEVSPFCEHNVAKPDKYLDIVARLMPGCSVVNTPWRGGISRKYKNEAHGEHAPYKGRYNFSFDGTNAVDTNIEAYKARHSKADTFFIWNPRLNLKWSMKDTTPRPERNAIPTKEFVDSLIYLFQPKGQTSIPKTWLIKSHAERHELNDFKGDKLLIIAPVKTDKIELKQGGKVVERLMYYGPFDGGGHRYYARRMGFQIGKVDVWVNGKKVGNINAGFRDGSYR